MMVFTINYSDDDGDLGLNPDDTLPPFHFKGAAYYNLLVDYEIKEGNEWKKVINPSTLDTIRYHQRFPRLNPTTERKKVAGTLDLRINATPYPGIKPEWVRFRFKMTDRALHQSNSISSGDINLKH